MELAYIAGFFDGEGSIGFYPSTSHGRRAYSFRIQVTQVDSPVTRSLLEELRVRFGGSIGWQASSSGRGKLSWQLNATRAAEFLAQILPFLVLKREQAEVAMTWHAERPRARRDERGRIVAFTTDERAACEAAVVLFARLKRT